MLSSAAYGIVARLGIPALLRTSDAAPILCFHNVVPDAVAGRHGDAALHMGVSEFAAVLDAIASRYAVIPLEELLDRMRSGRSLRGAACLTFDDAYRGVLAHAVPLLRQRGCPATVFIVSGAAEIPRPFWWDVLPPGDARSRDRLLYDLAGDARLIMADRAAATSALPEDLLPADWETLGNSLDDLVVPGCHSATHRNLSALSPAEIDDELRASRDAILERLRPSRVLAYPYGFASPKAVSAAARAGFSGAVTLGFGRVRRGSSLLALPRVNIPSRLGTDRLVCWASGLRLAQPPIRLCSDSSATEPSGEPPKP